MRETTPKLPTAAALRRRAAVAARAGSPQPEPDPEPTDADKPSVIDCAAAATVRAAWRWRWQLAPVAGLAATTAAATVVPGTVAGWSTITAVIAAGALRTGGHTLLRSVERQAVAVSAAATSVWATAITFAPGVEVSAASVGVLAAATAWPAWQWARNRAPWATDTTEPHTEGPRWSSYRDAVVGAWPVLIAAEEGPGPGLALLRGSTVDETTVTEPSEGTVVFEVELRDDVHCQQVTGENLRRALERGLHLPVDTTRLTPCPEDSGRVTVTLTPGRALQNTNADWEGPILADDGSVALALSESGDDVRAALWNKDGVEHGLVVGTTGTGKSNTLAALILPGVLNSREVVFFVDGGMGTSAAHLAGACDWWATDPDAWAPAIHAAWRVLKERKARRAASGLSRWRGFDEDEPVLTLVIEEATTVLRHLEAEKNTAAVDEVMELLREGRKLGVRVIQLAQDPVGSDLIGGRQARGLASGGGVMVGHRPGDGTSNMLATGSTASSVDLRTLPPEPGWCAVIRRGAVISARARVRYAADDDVRDLLIVHSLRSLDGPDATAAGTAYRRRSHGPAVAAAQAGIEAPTTPTVDPDDWDLTPPSTPTVGESAPTPAPPTTLSEVLAGLESAARPSTTPEEEEEDLSGSQRTAAARAAANRAAVFDAIADAGPGGIRRADLDDVIGEDMSRTTITRTLARLRDQHAIAQTPDGAWALVTQPITAEGAPA